MSENVLEKPPSNDWMLNVILIFVIELMGYVARRRKADKSIK